MLETKVRSKLARSSGETMHGLIKAGSRDSTNEPPSSLIIGSNQTTSSQVIPTVLQKISNITESSVLKKLPKEHVRIQFVEKLKQTLHSGYIASYKSTKYFSPLQTQSVISPARVQQQATTRHSTTTTQSLFPHYPYPSFNDMNAYKKNEFYSIFVSVLTAAAFLFFIMWRWFKMRSDLKRSLEEQEQIQQHERSELNTNTNQDDCVDRISGTSNNGIRWPNNGGRYMLIANNREELQNYAATLINQLSNGDYRTPREHQQMIDTARYCLQQLKLHARLTQHYRLQNNGAYYGRNSSSNYYYNNYSTFNSNRRDRRSNASYGSTASSAFLHDYCSSTQSLNQSAPATFNLPPAPPASSTSLSSSCTNDYVNFRLGPSTHGSVYNSTLSTNITNQAKKQVHNEPPPAYESLLVKSSSLPSYCHLSDGKEDARKESYDKNTSSNDDATRKK